MMNKQLLTNFIACVSAHKKHIFMGKNCLLVITDIWVTQILINLFFGTFSWRPSWKRLSWPYRMRFASGNMFHRKEHETTVENIDFGECCGVHVLNMSVCDPFDLLDPKIYPFWCQDKQHTTILIVLPYWPRAMNFDPFVKYFCSYLGLAPGRIQSGLKKMILGGKFHILGIKTTFGKHIAKNLPVSYKMHYFG